MCENNERVVWKAGDVAVAWLSKKRYAKVTVVGDNRLLNCDKGMGIIVDEEPTRTGLCYLVETWCTRTRLWVPWTALRDAEAFGWLCGLGHDSIEVFFLMKTPGQGHTKKVVLKMDRLLPFAVSADCAAPAFDSSWDRPVRLEGAPDRAFREYVLKGKEVFSDTCYATLTRDEGVLNSRRALDHFLQHPPALRLPLVPRDLFTERELEGYLQRCWAREISGGAPVQTWCVVCGGGGAGGGAAGSGRGLCVCPRCPATFHRGCRKQWLTQIIHRNNPPKKTPYKEALLKSQLRPARHSPPPAVTVATSLRDIVPCPACMWECKPSEGAWYMGTCPLTYRRLALEDGPHFRVPHWL